jgi:PBP1b-binding outer membrane lipoprotein LpoB
MQTKKILLFALLATIFLSSCSTVKKTATTIDVASSIQSASTADLEVSKKKITYTYMVPSKVARGGEKNMVNAAVAEALKENGNADVLVAPQYEIRKKIVVVTGYPATYKNFTGQQ